jgi:hypothetical protein
MPFTIEPSRIVFEGSEFILYDVSDQLPRHKNFPHGTSVVKPNGRLAVPGYWKFREVPGRRVDTMYCHQTAGAVTYDGFEALLNTWSFLVRDPSYTSDGKWKGNGRGWPGGAYTYYLPYRPIIYKGKVVIFKCWDHDWVTWHSSDNDHSEAIVCQGYFRHRSMKRFRPRKGCPLGRPSEAQDIALMAFLLEYAVGEMGIPEKNVKGHCDSPNPKAACPGDAIEGIYRAIFRPPFRAIPDTDPPVFPEVAGVLDLNTWKERQAALVLLGHYIGSYGLKNNGVDGDPGNLTRGAIETEEMNLGLKIDGYWDDVFDYHVKMQLLARGKEQEDIDELII